MICSSRIGDVNGDGMQPLSSLVVIELILIFIGVEDEFDVEEICSVVYDSVKTGRSFLDGSFSDNSVGEWIHDSSPISLIKSPRSNKITEVILNKTSNMKILESISLLSLVDFCLF